MKSADWIKADTAITILYKIIKTQNNQPQLCSYVSSITCSAGIQLSSHVMNGRVTALYDLHKLYIYFDPEDAITFPETQGTHISKNHSLLPSSSQQPAPPSRHDYMQNRA